MSPSDEPPLSASYPERIADENPLWYRFYIPGLWFLLLTGELAEDQRNMCILRSPFHPIAFYVGGDALVQQINYNLYMENKSGK